jgi:hypothetical protein
VLEPLGVTGSSFPARSADLGPEAVTGYDVTPEGAFVPVPAMICTIPVVGGLWATAADIVRLGRHRPARLLGPGGHRGTARPHPRQPGARNHDQLVAGAAQTAGSMP